MPILGFAAAVLVAAGSLAPAAGGVVRPGDRLRADAGENVVPGEAIVRFEPGTDAAGRRDARRDAGVQFERGLRLPRAQLVEVEGSVAAAVRRLERQDDVAYAQPNYRYRALAPSPNDTQFEQLWGLRNTGQAFDGTPGTPGVDVNALNAWDDTRGGGQVIAIVDSGVDLTHPDLLPNLWTNQDPPNDFDDDGNGIKDDTRGADFIHNDGDPDDHEFHGTHVAGTAAAVDDNARGIAGAAPDSQIMAVRVLDGDGGGSSSEIANGIVYAAREGANVINLSLGGPAGPDDQVLSQAITEADQRNVVVVAAAGNEGSDNDADPFTPCTFTHPNLICVAAVDHTGGLPPFSNFGATTVDVGAPGTSILSAKTAYDPLYSEGFESPITGTWNLESPWARAAETPSAGTFSLTDSPGGNYGFDVDVQANKATRVSLAGRRGCRMHWAMELEVESGFDVLGAGVLEGPLIGFDGTTNGEYFPVELTVEQFDNNGGGATSGVRPVFRLISDSEFNFDGAHIDELVLQCRGSTYAAPPSDAANYEAHEGTSMASPHVAGVAALLRAADPGAPDTEVVEALRAGVRPLPSLTGRTVTGGIVDADRSIDAIRALPNAPGGGGGTGAPPRVIVSLAGARRVIRVSRRRTFVYRFRATPGSRGTALFRSVRRLQVSARRRVTIARRRINYPRSGRVTLRIRLSRRNFRILRRKRRVVVRVSVTVTGPAGGRAATSRRLTLLAPRRRR